MTEEAQGGNLLTEEPPKETGGAETWYPDEYKELVTRTGWKEPGDALKSYRELEKSASGKIKLPTPESSAEEVSAFYAKIGRPENPDGYELTDIPENAPRDEIMESKLRQWAYENGITKTAFETVIRNYYNELTEQITQSRIQGEKTLKEEWKDSYDANLEVAKRFAKEGGDEFIAFLEDSGLGNNPTVIKAFYNYGKKILSDSLIKGQGGEGGKEDYVPQYKDSPEMYRNGDDEDSRKARAYFEARGYKY